MSEAGSAVAANEDWADEAGQAAEMPSIKLFGRWATDEISVGLVGLSRLGQSKPNS